MARLVRVPVSIALWQEIMTDGYKCCMKCIDGLPSSAELVNTYYDGSAQTVYLIFQHDSFDRLPEGGAIPNFIPTFQKLSSREVLEVALEEGFGLE